jgi:putative transposase
VRFAFILAEKALFPVSVLCRVLEVARSGFYAWTRRPESQRAREDRRLRVSIRAAWKKSRRTYGSPRLHDDLKADGEKVSRKRVARLMKEDDVVGRQRRRRFVVTTDSKHALPIAPNVLDRKFEVAAPNRVWAGDITYLATAEGWLYLAVIIDLFSRRVVGWAIEEHMETSLVMGALEMALRRRHRDGEHLLHHSDRGSQYAAADYRKRLSAQGVECSMSRKGNCWDNAVVESFFGTMKAELEDEVTAGASRAVARSAVADYIDNFYNSTRKHSSLGYLSPINYEASVRMGRAA